MRQVHRKQRNPRRYGFPVLILCSIFAATIQLQAWSQPVTDPQRADATEIWNHVTVYRDGWGTPHIFANDLYTLAFGFGYAQAEDHIEGMMLAYRVANGAAAEVLGEPLAESDAFAIKMRHGELAREAFATADPVTIDLCEGFAAGVNAWLIDHPFEAPEWVDGAQPEDVLALLHCYLMSFAPFDLDGTYARSPAAASGNAWAIGPPKSETGESMLFINPHTDYTGPFQWYEAHLVTPDLNVAGCTLFGLPVIMQGHNESLGWALTPNHPDFADVYLESDVVPRPKRDPKSVMDSSDSGGRARRRNRRTQEFLVKMPDGGVERRAVDCADTVRGPIVGRYEDADCSYCIGGYYDFGSLFQLFQMGAAHNLDEFQGALDLHQLPCFHITYADQEGNIFYVYNAKFHDKRMTAPPEAQPEDEGVPELKGKGELVGEIVGEFGDVGATPDAGMDSPPLVETGPPLDWTHPVPANDRLYAWGDAIPPSSLPALLNPDSGYIQACGNPPWTATDNSALWAAEWPEGLALDEDTFRARRARRLLGLGTRAFHDLQSMAFDVLVPFAMTAAPALLEASEKQADFVATLHPDLAGGLDQLRAWNYVADANSTGMTFFHVWMAALQSLAPGIASEREFEGLFQEKPEAFQKDALRAASEAAKLMRNEFNSMSVPWSSVHRIRRGLREEFIPGCASSLFVASDVAFDNGKWWTTYGYGFAMAVRFGETPEAVTLAPFGASELARSPHYSDQLDLLINQRFKTASFLQEEVQRKAQYAFGRRLVLRPLGMEAVFKVQSATPVSAGTTLSPELPGPLPEGRAPFSVAATLKHTPEETPIDVQLEVTIPVELCKDEDLPGLSLYAYSPGVGWKPLPNQQFTEPRVLVARDKAARTYAVLGPAAAAIPGVSPATFVPKPGDMLSGDTRTKDAAPDASEPKGAIVPKPPQPEAGNQDPLEPRAADEPEQSAPKTESNNEEMGQPNPETGNPAEETNEPVRPPIAWGQNMDLSAREMNATVHVRAKTPIGSRLAVKTEPPAPLPDGLAACTDYLTVDCSAPKEVEGITIALTSKEGAAAPPSSMKVYAYDASDGWTPLSEQAKDPDKPSITAKDNRPRTYAILAPGAQAPTTGDAAPAEAPPASALDRATTPARETPWSERGTELP